MSGSSRWEVMTPTPSPAQRRSMFLWGGPLLALWVAGWVMKVLYPDASWVKVALSVVIVLVSIGAWRNIAALQRDLRRRQDDPDDPGGPGA